MHLLITGAAGRIGAHVAREALKRGHRVRAFDQLTPYRDLRNTVQRKRWAAAALITRRVVGESPAVHGLYARARCIPRSNLSGLRREYGRDRLEFIGGDLTNRKAVLRAVEGCDAIIHLAAIPDPLSGHTERLLHVNVTGTGYLFEGAEAHGVERMVLASSAAIYGMAFTNRPFLPQYLLLDEEHPILPHDIYALSKQCGEEIAATYTRRTDMTTFCLRPPLVTELHPAHRERQKRQLNQAHEKRGNELWTYLEVTDCARAFVMAAESPVTGHHRLLLSARDSWLRGDVRDAVRQCYPSLERFLDGVEPHDSLYSCRRAQEVLGWQPERSWRDIPELAEGGEG